MCWRIASSSSEPSRRTRQHVDATVQFQAALKQATDYFMAHGSALAQAHQQAPNWIAQQLQTQVALLAYIDVFWALILISIAAVPLALTLRKVKLGGPAPVAHW